MTAVASPEPGGPTAGWASTDLLGIEELSPEDVALVLDRAEAWWSAGSRSPASAPLAGRTVARLFFSGGGSGANDPVAADPNAATSWDLAARRLGAETVEVTTEPARSDDGGALDSALDLDALGIDLLVVRHPHAGVPAGLARRLRAGVVNAGDGAHEDPAAALALALTLRRRLGALEGRRVTLLGDFTHSAAARSLAHLLVKVGAEATVGGLHALVPAAVESLGVRHAPTPDEAVEGAEAIVVLPPAPAARDGRTYPSAREYHRVAGLTAERLAGAAAGAAVLHARPVTRGLEIAAEVADGPASALAEQKGDALAVRMAVLELLTEATAEGAAGGAL